MPLSPPRATTRATPTSRRVPVAGRGPSWTAPPPCAPWCWPGCNRAGPRNRWPAASPGTSPSRASPTKPSIAFSMPNWPASKRTPGATICRRPKPNAAGGAQAETPRHRDLLLRHLCALAKRRQNALGRLRRILPRKTDLAALSDDHFTQLVQAYNNTPRKCLGYQTPAEVFRNHLLHFKCESTRFLQKRSRHAATTSTSKTHTPSKTTMATPRNC